MTASMASFALNGKLENHFCLCVIALLFTIRFASPAFSWNEKGHYVVCRLAWLQMTDQWAAKDLLKPQ